MTAENAYRPRIQHEDGVLILPQKTFVTPVLGRLRVEGAELNTARTPAQNSSRWVFDVEGGSGGDIAVRLLEFRSMRPLMHELVSIALTPLSVHFYDAKPFCWLEPGVVVLKTLRTPTGCSYRVSIDAIYSTTR
jgi:hypothetical protein